MSQNRVGFFNSLKSIVCSKFKMHKRELRFSLWLNLYIKPPRKKGNETKKNEKETIAGLLTVLE